MEIFLIACECAEVQLNSGVNFVAQKERCFHPVGVFEYRDLRESWVYRLMSEWFLDEDSTNELVHDVKKRLFEISMRS